MSLSNLLANVSITWFFPIKVVPRLKELIRDIIG